VSVRQRIWWKKNGQMETAWIAVYRGDDGRRHARTFAEKEQAEVFHAQVGRKRPRRNKLYPAAWNDPKNLTRSEILQLCLMLDRKIDELKRLIAKTRKQWL
jgi:hypothetical protein